LLISEGFINLRSVCLYQKYLLISEGLLISETFVNLRSVC